MFNDVEIGSIAGTLGNTRARNTFVGSLFAKTTAKAADADDLRVRVERAAAVVELIVQRGVAMGRMSESVALDIFEALDQIRSTVAA